MEMAITIRTLLQSGSRVSVQSGAGIVHDSVPESEYEETVAKARALFAAVAQAQARTLAQREPEPREAPPEGAAPERGAR
jgi:anthranilate synthase component 1